MSFHKPTPLTALYSDTISFQQVEALSLTLESHFWTRVPKLEHNSESPMLKLTKFPSRLEPTQWAKVTPSLWQSDSVAQRRSVCQVLREDSTSSVMKLEMRTTCLTLRDTTQSLKAPSQAGSHSTLLGTCVSLTTLLYSSRSGLMWTTLIAALSCQDRLEISTSR